MLQSQVQVRDKLVPGSALPKIHNGVIRVVRPNGTYLVGFGDGNTRHVLRNVLVEFVHHTAHAQGNARRRKIYGLAGNSTSFFVVYLGAGAIC